MKLQFKAWGLVLATFGFLTLVAIGVSSSVISDRFSALEQEQAKVEGERARRLLEQQHINLSATLKDYAYWVDTVAFIGGAASDYLDENFTAETMKSLRISEAMFMNLQGEQVAGVTLKNEVSIGALSAERTQLLRHLAQPVLRDLTGDSVVSTYAQAGGKLYMISVAAVRLDGKSGTPPFGALAMVREFDQKELVDFSRILMHPVSLALTDLSPAGAFLHTTVEDDNRAHVHAVVLDHTGEAVAELVLQLDRSLHQKGKSLAQATGVAVAFAGLLMGGLLAYLLDRLLLRRLQGIHRDVQSITAQGLIGEQCVREVGKDELTHLARGVNRLLERVREDAAKQQAAFERQEALQLQLMQSQKTEALGRLSSGIAHDINNSLAAIGGWIRLADEDLDPKHPSHESLQYALKGALYADGIMRQLLAFSRQSLPKLEPIEVSFLIRESRGLVASGLLRTCELNVDGPSEPMWVLADLTQMQQVLVNLLINAADALDGVGKISLSVSTYEAKAESSERTPKGASVLLPGSYVQLSIRDEGHGIAPENVDRIFEPFFTTKSMGRGTGLGLSVAHGIMAKNGGGIGVQSQLGSGTTFGVFLPACEAPSNMGASKVDSA